MAVLKGYADKRTEKQRKDDAAQEAKPKGTQDTTYVTIGSATGKVDGCDDSLAPLVREEIPVMVVPSKSTGGVIDDAGGEPGVKH